GRIIDAGLDSSAWDSGDPIAGQNLDIAVEVGKRAVGADLQGVKKSRVDKGIAGIKLQGARAESDFGLDALAARRTDVLEIAKSLQHRTWNCEDVVRVVRPKGPELPSERADVQLFGAAQAGFHGAGYDLFQRRIRDQECRNDAWTRRIGAAQFQRGWRAIGFRIACICR